MCNDDVGMGSYRDFVSLVDPRLGLVRLGFKGGEIVRWPWLAGLLERAGADVEQVVSPPIGLSFYFCERHLH
jgi:hypothetical protein